MDDFPNEAAKLLSMVEWWELLNVSASEIDEINRFRKLSEAQKTMLLSAKNQIVNIPKVWYWQQIWKRYSVLYHRVYFWL